jgi:hypothetical protein
MKRHRIIKAVAVVGLLAAGLLIIRPFYPKLPKVIEPEAKRNVVSQSLPPNLSEETPFVQTTNLNPVTPPFQAPISQDDQLIALHEVGELFGVGADVRMKQLQDFVDSLDDTNVPAMVRELQELQMNNSTATGRDLQLRLLRRWAASDMQAAADWTAQMPAGSERNEAIASMASAWSEQDVAQAATWAGQMPDGIERQSALESVAAAAVYVKPQDALTLASTFASSVMRDDIITRASEALAWSAPEDAVSYAKEIPDEALREQVISAIATTFGEQDPVAAGNLVLDLIPAGSSQDQAVVAIVQRWAVLDPAGAKAWTDQFPDGALRQTATTMLEHSLMLAGPHFQPTFNDSGPE